MFNRTQKNIIEFIIIFLLTITVLGVLEYRSSFFEKTDLHAPKVVIIQKGMGLSSIAQLLYEKDVIPNERFFVSIVKLQNAAHQLQAGRYIFYPEETVAEIIKKLEKGETHEENITFPEGITRFQIGRIISRQAEMDSSKFVNWAESDYLIQEFNIEAETLEGYLYPETYKIYWGMTERELVEKMVQNFWKVFNDSLIARSDELEMSIEEVVTLASIVEKEAQVDKERTLIAAVFHNRLKRGQKLESCATVLYALGKHKERLLNRDLEIQSPYNTYIHTGLPPAPICNPGKASIEAALYPADVDYYYFVSKGDGTHIFSKTGRGHINAKNAQKRKSNN
jgi:UPF0755 protein